MTLVEKQQQRGQHVEAMRKILDKAEGERRALTAEEDQEYQRLDGAQERLKVEIAREERQKALDDELAALPGGDQRDRRPQPSGGAGDRATVVIPEAFRSLHDRSTPEARHRIEVLASPAYLRAFRSWVVDGVSIAAAPEFRDLQADVFTAGGALVAPLEMSAALLKAIDDQTFVRQYASKTTVVTADALGIASLDADPADSDWTSEVKTGSKDTAMAFGRRELRPHPLAKRALVSNKLLRAAAAAESLVRNRLEYKFGVTEEKAFLTGDGNQKPLGLFTASDDGIPTSRDVATGNAATSIGADGLVEAKYSIKAGYWPRLRWIFHRDAVKQVRKLKDGNGQFIWQAGLSGGQPDRILDTPFDISEFAPNTFTSGLYVGVIGDLSMYQIADALTLTVQRLVELYAETNQTGFIGRLECDGQPVMAEAFARVKLG